MDGVLIKQVLFADDVNIFIEYDEETLRRVIAILEEFKSLSGLKIALNKTQVIYLGGVYNPQMKLCEDIELTWNQSFKLSWNKVCWAWQ